MSKYTREDMSQMVTDKGRDFAEWCFARYGNAITSEGFTKAAIDKARANLPKAIEQIGFKLTNQEIEDQIEKFVWSFAARMGQLCFPEEQWGTRQ